jgi:hypothetical protein
MDKLWWVWKAYILLCAVGCTCALVFLTGRELIRRRRGLARPFRMLRAAHRGFWDGATMADRRLVWLVVVLLVFTVVYGNAMVTAAWLVVVVLLSRYHVHVLQRRRG